MLSESLSSDDNALPSSFLLFSLLFPPLLYFSNIDPINSKQGEGNWRVRMQNIFKIKTPFPVFQVMLEHLYPLPLNTGTTVTVQQRSLGSFLLELTSKE